MRNFKNLFGGNDTGTGPSTLAEHVRERRDDKFERATLAEVDPDADERPVGGLRICAATGDPMLATDAQLDAERDLRRLRMVRRKANK